MTYTDSGVSAELVNNFRQLNTVSSSIVIKNSSELDLSKHTKPSQASYGNNPSGENASAMNSGESAKSNKRYSVAPLSMINNSRRFNQVNGGGMANMMMMGQQQAESSRYFVNNNNNGSNNGGGGLKSHYRIVNKVMNGFAGSPMSHPSPPVGPLNFRSV